MSGVSLAVRDVYVELVRNGGGIMRNSLQHGFAGRLNGLDPVETMELLSLLEKSVGDQHKVFADDSEALAAVAALPQAREQLTIGRQPPRASGPEDPVVMRGLAEFERKLSLYARHPDRIAELQAGMSAAQAEALLGALCDNYPMVVLHGYWQLGSRAEELGGGDEVRNQVDESRVAEIFRRLLADFTAYRQSPGQFEELLAGLSPAERRMLDALVTAFWDWQ